MADSSLTATEIVVVVLIAAIALLLVGFIIYKTVKARNQSRRLRLIEQGTATRNSAHEGRLDPMQAKSPTANELEDLETKAGRSDKNSEEQPDQDPPSLNA